VHAGRALATSTNLEAARVWGILAMTFKSGSAKYGPAKSSAAVWMGAAFCAALAVGLLALAVFGRGVWGVSLATVSAARVAFVFFWLTYTGGALAALFGSAFDGLARRRREFGLAFASALLVHLALVAWLFRISARQPIPDAWIVYFGVGALSAYVLALGSLTRFRSLWKTRFWRIFGAVALEYIAFLFFRDFVVLPFQLGLGMPLSYLPFAALIILGISLRVAATVQRWRAYV
jgi:hypothetical protein